VPAAAAACGRAAADPPAAPLCAFSARSRRHHPERRLAGNCIAGGGAVGTGRAPLEGGRRRRAAPTRGVRAGSWGAAACVRSRCITCGGAGGPQRHSASSARRWRGADLLVGRPGLLRVPRAPVDHRAPLEGQCFDNVTVSVVRGSWKALFCCICGILAAAMVLPLGPGSAATACLNYTAGLVLKELCGVSRCT